MIWRKSDRGDEDEIPLLTEVVGMAGEPDQQADHEPTRQAFQHLTQTLAEQTLQRVAPLLEDVLTDPLRLSIEERLQAMLPGLVDAISGSLCPDLQGLGQEAVTPALPEARPQVEADAREATSESDNRTRRL